MQYLIDCQILQKIKCCCHYHRNLGEEHYVLLNTPVQSKNASTYPWEHRMTLWNSQSRRGGGGEGRFPATERENTFSCPPFPIATKQVSGMKWWGLVGIPNVISGFFAPDGLPATAAIPSLSIQWDNIWFQIQASFWATAHMSFIVFLTSK